MNASRVHRACDEEVAAWRFSSSGTYMPLSSVPRKIRIRVRCTRCTWSFDTTYNSVDHDEFWSVCRPCAVIMEPRDECLQCEGRVDRWDERCLACAGAVEIDNDLLPAC